MVCCVRVVVTVVVGGGAVIVIVRSAVAVCVIGAGPQAASNAVLPRRVAANTSRMLGFVLVTIRLPDQGKSGSISGTNWPYPIRRPCYWVIVVLVSRVVVTATGAGYVVVFETLSDATPLLSL